MIAKALLVSPAPPVVFVTQKNGMFYQVVNMPGEKGNYLETSGTCMVACAIMKAVRLRFLPERYREYGRKAFLGTAKQYFHVENDVPTLGGIYLVSGLGGAKNRDGTPEYYYGEQAVSDEGKGIATFLLAYAEMLRAQSEN